MEEEDEEEEVRGGRRLKAEASKLKTVSLCGTIFAEFEQSLITELSRHFIDFT